MSKPRFEFERAPNASVTNDELISDLKRVAALIRRDTVTMHQYRDHGRHDDTTVARRFGSWNAGLKAAGLKLSNEVNIDDERLFNNILVLWQHYGRQPRRAELGHPPSTISQSPYNRRFGSWSKALRAFVNFANSGDAEIPERAPQPASRPPAGRDPSLRLRWTVLHGDNFTCRGCGASPALTPGVELQVDHVVPWSKGGRTEKENLQTLCSRCNLGKSNT